MRKYGRAPEEEHVSESWLIPYADILTLLLALFIILFAASELNQKKYEQLIAGFNTAFKGTPYKADKSGVTDVKSATKDNKDSTKNEQLTQVQIDAKVKEIMNKETQDMIEMKKSIDKYIVANGLRSQIETQLNSDMLLIRIRDNAIFDSGQATVKPDSQKLAAAISKILCKYTEYNVEIAGHTDNLPISGGEFKSNWGLSAQRAVNFMAYLVDTSDINPSRFRAVGYGEYKPISSNDTEEGRSTNRRVEVDILRSVRATNLVPAINS